MKYFKLFLIIIVSKSKTFSMLLKTFLCFLCIFKEGTGVILSFLAAVVFLVFSVTSFNQCSFTFILSLRRRSRYTASILEMKVQLSLRCWWGILPLSGTRTMRYYHKPNQLNCLTHLLSGFVIFSQFRSLTSVSFFFYFRYCWSRLPSCPPQRAGMAPT